MTIKGQTLVDFFVEFCNVPESKELPIAATWVVYIDGSSTNNRSGVGVTLSSLEGEKFQYTIELDFINMNNEAKYEAVLAELPIAMLNSGAIPKWWWATSRETLKLKGTTLSNNLTRYARVSLTLMGLH